MGSARVRRCGNCGGPLPKEARSTRRYCCAACRAEQWRKVRRSSQLYRAAVDELVAAGILGRGPTAREVRAQWPREACPVCGRRWWVGLSKRADARFCSPRCRTAAWRERTGQVPKWLVDLRAQQARAHREGD